MSHTIFENMVKSALSVKEAGGLLLPQEEATLWAAETIANMAEEIIQYKAAAGLMEIAVLE